jgi:hypothetical protein
MGSLDQREVLIHAEAVLVRCLSGSRSESHHLPVIGGITTMGFRQETNFLCKSR